jgi:transposase-like protein
MTGNSTEVHDRDGLHLKHPLEHCPSCRSTRLRAVSDGETVNFFCDDCERCWHVELGYVHRVNPRTCPGCAVRERCTARYERDHMCIAPGPAEHWSRPGP